MAERLPLPYGNIFQVGTPYLDQLNDRLYAQQKLNEQRRYQQFQSLDDDFRRDVANIRKADIPDFTKAYQEYKNAKINLLKGNNGRNFDPMKAEQEANEKLAKAYSILNESATEKAWEKDLATKIHSNWKQYNDDATDLLKTRMQVPVGGLPTFTVKGRNGEDLNLYGDDAYRYKGNFDFSKDIKGAFGNARELGVVDETTDPKALERTMAKYRGFNNPYQAYQILLNSLADPRKAEEFIKTHQFSPVEEKQIEDNFKSIVGKDAFKKIHSLKGDEGFIGDDTDLGKAAKLSIMLGTTDLARSEMPKTKVKETIDYKNELAKEMQDRAQRNSLQRLFVYAGIQDRKPEAIGRNIDEVIANHIQDARDNNGEVVTDNATYESITGKKKTGSSVLLFDEQDSKYKYGTKDATTGEVKITGEVPSDLAKVKLTKTYKAGLDSRYNTGKKVETKTEYKLNGKTYKLDQIQKAAKASGMTVEQYIKQAGLQ